MSELGIGDAGDLSGESWNIVPSEADQGDIFNSIVNAQAANNLAQPPAVSTASTTPPQASDPSGGSLLSKLFANPNPGASAISGVNNNIVTRAIANQGQLLPIPNSGTSGKPATSDDLKKLLGAIQESNAQTQSQEATTSASKPSSGGGGGGVLGDIASVATAVLAWIICTELVRQGKMPFRWYIAGGSVFAAYPEVGKRGYYLWAIPSVRHLRRYPDSYYSKFLTVIFLWRAENIAASKGIKGARKLWRGAIVTAILYPLCCFLGFILWCLGKDFDWMQVYGAET